MERRCPNCGKTFATLNTRVVGDTRIRYVGCRECKVRPKDNKVYVPLQYAPRRECHK